jgi:hypothetical protein
MKFLLLICIVAIILAVLLAINIWTVALRNNLLGSFLASVSALIIGIPIGLQVNRLVQNQTDNALKQRVLSLTREELEFDLRTLDQRRQDTDNGIKRHVLLVPLKDDLWRAFVSSGDTKSINNPELIAIISAAYYYVDVTNLLEGRWWNIVTFPGIQAPLPQGEKSRPEQMIDGLSQTDETALPLIRRAIDAINEEVPSN